MQIPFNLSANIPARANVRGSYIGILSIGAAASISLTLRRGNEIIQEVYTATRGLMLGDDGGYDAIEVSATVACMVQILTSNSRITFDNFSGATVNVSALTPLSVSNDRGTPGTPVYVSGITYSDAPAVSLNEPAAVAVTAAATLLHAANAARRGGRYTNIGANACAIGGAALTWAKRAIILQPGDTWIEERAANLAIYAICDTALATTVGVQEVIS